jgi:8-oxo-dGTP diphosphatase
MQTILNFAQQNPVLSVVLALILVIALRWSLVNIFVPLIREEGREFSIWGLKIGKRESISIESADDQDGNKIYLSRKEIHWEPYNLKVSARFWAAGTTLVAVGERHWVEEFCRAGVDVKLILPSFESHHISYSQLMQYDRFELVYDQVEAARKSYKLLAKKLAQFERPLEEYLRRYSGIMYANITIFDRDAFIAYYDTTGVGDSSVTLHFDKDHDELGYRKVEQEFLRMWHLDKDFGNVAEKSKGTSMIFVNREDKVLLFLRDDKPEIPYRGCWDLLGGHVEDSETPEECIVREIREELGIQIKVPNVFRIEDMVDRIEHTFWMAIDLDIGQIQLSEGKRLKWFAEDELRSISDDRIAFDFKRVLLEFYLVKPTLSRVPNG